MDRKFPNRKWYRNQVPMLYWIDSIPREITHGKVVLNSNGKQQNPMVEKYI